MRQKETKVNTGQLVVSVEGGPPSAGAGQAGLPANTPAVLAAKTQDRGEIADPRATRAAGTAWNPQVCSTGTSPTQGKGAREWGSPQPGQEDVGCPAHATPALERAQGADQELGA